MHRYIPLSRELESYLVSDVGVLPGKVQTICNGVSLERFQPCDIDDCRRAVLPEGFATPDQVVVGAVGRLEEIKDPLTLVRGFWEFVDSEPTGRKRFRLVIVGDGSQRKAIESTISEGSLQSCVWLAGTRADVADCLRSFDTFVLPSLGEGISNTILEAMASGLPVIATNVGGNSELVDPGVTGFLVPRGVPSAIADRLKVYAAQPELRMNHGAQGRKRAETEFDLDRMIARYLEVYDDLLRRSG